MDPMPNTPAPALTAAENDDLLFTIYRAVSLLAVTLLVFLLWQAWSGYRQYRIWEQQAQNRATVAQQAQQVQVSLQALGQGLLELAKTDPDAAAIINKYKIATLPGAGGIKAGVAPTR
jgi:hypothetical protein